MLCKLCCTKYFSSVSCVHASVSQASVCKSFLAPKVLFCARGFSVTVRALWRTEQLRWVEKNFREMRGLIHAQMRWKELRRTCLDDMWQKMGWDEKSCDEVIRAHMIWNEKNCEVWSAGVKCEVLGLKSVMWSVKKVFAWRCVARGLRAGHVLGQQQCNRFGQSMHARAWLAHSACKVYRCEKSKNPKATSFPPRAGITDAYIYIFMCLHEYMYLYMCVFTFPYT